MGSKNLKKSTMRQLRTLVDYMEENPDLAKGLPRFGANKRSAEEEWKFLCKKINSQGPPMRTLSDWKKTWADLKSRTKKKIIENEKSQHETGGLLYRHNHLTELEQIIEKILYSSSSLVNNKYFEDNTENNTSHPNTDPFGNCFQPLVRTPTRSSTPSEIDKREMHVDCQHQHNSFNQTSTSNSESEQGSSYLAKKRKGPLDEQLASIRRQIRMVERSAATAKFDTAERLADAAEAQAESAKRNAVAAEAIALSMKAMAETTKRIETLLENYMLNTKNKNI